MWQEARRQERKIRGMLVDYRKRADRRREYYDKIKLEPTRFLQIHGRPCKIYLDQNISWLLENTVMVPWKGHTNNLIDRFDVRAHLDHIPVVQNETDEALTQEERFLNYERYRIIAQNSFLGIPEEKCLRQINIEEQFGIMDVKTTKGGAAIGYNYEDNPSVKDSANLTDETAEKSEDDNSDSDLDVDLVIDVSKINLVQANELNTHARNFGMSSNDFYSFLINDVEEAKASKLARAEEKEKAMYAGRKSRKERRNYRDKMLANRSIGVPAYAKTSPEKISLTDMAVSRSSSSSSTDYPETITYITSFGSDDVAASTSQATNVKSQKRDVYDMNSRRSTFKRSRSRSSNTCRESASHQARESKSRLKNAVIAPRRRRRSRIRRSVTASSGCAPSSETSSSSSTSSRGRRKYRKSSTGTSNRTICLGSSSTESDEVRPQSRAAKLLTNKALPRYYGRRKRETSSSSSPTDEDTNAKKSEAPRRRPANIPLVEHLKRKRQALLNRQFKADKLAAQLKTQREKLEQQIRDDELRDLAIKLRMRRQRLHCVSTSTDSDSSDVSLKTRGRRYGGKSRECGRNERHKSTEICDGLAVGKVESESGGCSGVREFRSDEMDEK